MASGLRLCICELPRGESFAVGRDGARLGGAGIGHGGLPDAPQVWVARP